MQFNPNGPKFASGQSFLQSVEAKSIAGSEYVNVHGPFVTIKAFSAGLKSNESVSFGNVTVESMSQLKAQIKAALNVAPDSNVMVFADGKPVNDLNTFCKIVTENSGDTRFIVQEKR